MPLAGLQARNDTLVARLIAPGGGCWRFCVVGSRAVLVVQASGKAIWHDEIYTVVGAGSRR